MNKRTVFVTGGASGIGYGIAKSMMLNGHYVVIADINEHAAQEAVSRLINECEQQGVDCSANIRAVAVDVCDAQRVSALPDKLGELHVDVLINNAGIQHVAKLEDFPAHKWQKLINIMLVGPALLTQTFLPAMRENNFGRIINIGSKCV